MNIKLNRQSQNADTTHRLRIYLRALSVFTERYEGLEGVLKHIRQVVDCLDAHGNLFTLQSPDNQHLLDSASKIGNSVDIITCLPHFFLRTMVIIQLSFAEGEYPEEHELPPHLASSSESNARSKCTCASNESWDLPELGDAFQGFMDMRSPDSEPEWKQPGDVYMDGDKTQEFSSMACAGDFEELLELF